MKNRKFTIFYALILTLSAFAAAPSGYYYSAEGLATSVLRDSLYNIIKGHKVVSYDDLPEVYKTSDNTASNKVWDMYSTCTFDHTRGDRCGNYTYVCDCYNREHSIPQSWFNERSPMKSDAFHVYPTDGKVNGQRSSFPFGECAQGTSLGGKALGKVGSSTFSGYSGTVFEPDDQYKGDFARTYFYMATRYSDICENWGRGVFGSANNGLTNYAVALFLKWHRQDPVSQKEITRNDAVYNHQRNRNPFIDHPELAEYIWGNQKGNNWYANATDVEYTDIESVELYPNPAAAYFVIKSDQSSGIDYRIYNMSGQLLQQGMIQSEQQVAISNLSNGIYMLQIIIDGKPQHRKLVINQ